LTVATSAFLMTREAIVVTARAAIRDLADAVAVERFCEDGRLYAEHLDVWVTTYAHLVALRRDVARLVAELRPELVRSKK
jgi:hypothetical protein